MHTNTAAPSSIPGAVPTAAAHPPTRQPGADPRSGACFAEGYMVMLQTGACSSVSPHHLLACRQVGGFTSKKGPRALETQWAEQTVLYSKGGIWWSLYKAMQTLSGPISELPSCTQHSPSPSHPPAGLTLNIQQRKVVVVGGFGCQREVETMTTLRLVTVHNADSLDQLWGERRGEHQNCPAAPLGSHLRV